MPAVTMPLKGVLTTMFLQPLSLITTDRSLKTATVSGEPRKQPLLITTSQRGAKRPLFCWRELPDAASLLLKSSGSFDSRLRLLALAQDDRGLLYFPNLIRRCACWSASFIDCPLNNISRFQFSARSFQRGFSLSISAIFFERLQPFNCFSRPSALCTFWYLS